MEADEWVGGVDEQLITSVTSEEQKYQAKRCTGEIPHQEIETSTQYKPPLPTMTRPASNIMDVKKDSNVSFDDTREHSFRFSCTESGPSSLDLEDKNFIPAMPTNESGAEQNDMKHVQKKHQKEVAIEENEQDVFSNGDACAYHFKIQSS